MKRNKRNVRWVEGNQMNIAAAVLACAACLGMAVLPALALDSARDGVALWADTVLPALLPFFICADFLISLGALRAAGRFLERPVRKLFGVPGSAAFVFLISITSGYPMGAQLIGNMGRRGEITRQEGASMLTFCSTSGPLFILGAVGAGMLHSVRAGAVIAAAHYLGALVNGLLWKGVRSLKGEERLQPAQTSSVEFLSGGGVCGGNKTCLLDLFTQSIFSSLKSVGVICCYLILFTMLTDFLQFAGVLDFIHNGVLRGLVRGILEMTVGCSAMAESGEAVSAQIVGCAFLISFGGLSIMAQSMSALEGLKISPWYYLKIKLSHGILASFIAFLLVYVRMKLLPWETGMVFAPVGNGQAIEAGGTLSEFFSNLGFFSQMFFSSQAVLAVSALLGLAVLVGKRRK